MARPENIKELRDQLLDAYEWVKTDPQCADQVKEMTNAAGKIIGTLKIELEYAMLRAERPEIKFLDINKQPRTLTTKLMGQAPPKVQEMEMVNG